MPPSSSIGPASLTFHGHLVDERDPVEPAKITRNGSTAKVFAWDGARYREFDTIFDAKFADRSDHIEMTGTSRALVETVGMTPAESQVRVEIRTKGCKSCG